jgi:hypothetical protein
VGTDVTVLQHTNGRVASCTQFPEEQSQKLARTVNNIKSVVQADLWSAFCVASVTDCAAVMAEVADDTADFSAERRVELTFDEASKVLIEPVLCL